MATGTGNLPNPGMVFSPFDILTAEEMNDLVANIESLATGSGIGDGALDTNAYKDGSVTPAKISNPYKFRAYRSSAHNFTNAWTKIPFNAESFDLNNDYDNSTNFRYVAPMTGYYRFNARASTSQSSGTNRLLISLYKNGVEASRGTDVFAGYFNGSTVGDLMYLTDGDYVEVFALANGTIAADIISSVTCYFSGELSL